MWTHPSFCPTGGLLKVIPATLSSWEPHPNRSLGNKGFQESVSTKPLTFKCVSPPGGKRSCAVLLLFLVFAGPFPG